MTSATGISERPARDAGFTLVELVVAMLIIGIASAAIVLGLPDGRDSARTAAERLAARAVAARDLAIVSGRPVRLAPAAGGITLLVATPAGWQAPPEAAMAGLTLPAGLALVASPEGPIDFDATGLASPARLLLSGNDGAAAVTIDAAGGVHAGPA
ncbi:GspH/FimT family pseudopilin [Sandarakinorhabdus rubra]|uniref:GspH/FimT family pseudopilin n=1 Tax=Sandarakinorhabdus rubra TaxID=2672568 RepID=UPI0013D99ED5|nr:GspH/FimT family pseudopilin [Sandarakinorhabdus rubra]